MNKYTIKIELEDGGLVTHELEALGASVNYNSGVIEAAMGEGTFTVIKLPKDWTRIDADQELGEQPDIPLPVPVAEVAPVPIPAPVAAAPPGQ